MLKEKILQLPAAWISSGEGYAFHVDTKEDGNDCGWISSNAENRHRGILKQRLSVSTYSGKRIKLVGLCRSENVSRRAGLLLRTEKLNGRPLTSDDMVDRPLLGTTDWHHCEMIIDVPTEATAIAIGAHLIGTGQVWFKDLQIEEVSTSTPTTDEYALGCVDLWDLEPVNLDFSQDEYLPGHENLPFISAARRWVISWEPDGPPYEMTRPADVLFEGKPTACLRPVSKSGTGYLYQHFAAVRYRNKRVRYSLYIKTKRVKKGAHLFFDMYDADSNDLLFVKPEPGITGTKDWTKLELDIEIPIEAYTISIGAILDGPGEMYMGGLEFGVISAE